MTTNNERLDGIQARIEDLQNTISEKEEQIKARAYQFKEDLKTELSPLEVIKKHPFETAGAVLAAGFFVGRALRPSRRAENSTQAEIPVTSNQSSAVKIAIGSLGIDILRSAKDLGFTYLQRYLDRKIR
ncbi:hypothetical protein [Chlorobium limicola]|uniref:DUF3618 domain-containing protein n=1 Tax=Chlorobium limicola TaxID=1092 RepID=A0A101JPC1_CHLLI|nr:hypothetical protein [Chlorobium limicola]KUL30458.1 hypothetical protein ASB62_04070 [Chlorobium limicola]